MPHWWLPVPSNPKSPPDLRNTVRKAVSENGGKLIGNEVWFESKTQGYALVECADSAIGAIVSGIPGSRKTSKLSTADEIGNQAS